MRIACLCLLAVSGLSGGSALRAQENASPGDAPELSARYLPLEYVRDGIVRMPKALTRKVSVRRHDVPLQQVLLDIATQARLGLSYGEDLARANTVVSLDLTNASAADALAAAVRGTQWAVLVTARGQVAVLPAEHRQLGTVAGRVTDRATGLGVPNTGLALEGTRLTATADDSGRFRIANVPAGTYTVTARRIGYARASRSVTVAADEIATADFVLDATATTLDRIVVTGVPGAVSKRTLGNAITTIDVGEVIQQSATANVTELLQAKAPGVTVLPGGGSPGTGASIRIRGSGSLVASTAPVIYVDGVRVYTGPQGNFWNSWRSQRLGSDGQFEKAYGAGQDAMALDMLKPEDIESIEVIKGPAAATLYGAEAANGVVQIITTKGKRGEQKLQWAAKAQMGSTDWAVDRVTNYTTCTPALTALRFSDGTPQFPGCQGVPANTILTSRSLDLPGALRSGAVHNYALSVRGGGQRYSFFLAADRDAEEGVFYNSANQRSGARANFALYPQDNLDLTINVGYGYTHTQFPINDDGFGLIQAAMLYRPGRFVRTDLPGQRDGFDGGGPEAVYQWDNRLRAHRMILGSTVNYRPFSWLKNRLTVGIDQTSRLADKYLPPGSLWSGPGQAERGAPQNSIYTVDYAGTAERDLPFGLSSALSVGVQYTANYFRNTIARGVRFASGNVREVALAAETQSFTEVVDQKSLGLYVQEQVGWKDRLYVTGAVRVDNSSVFGDEIKQLYFPKFSAAYVISEEPFMQRYGWLNELKLRAAWGQAGNAPRPFADQRSYTSAPTINEAGERVPALRTNAYGNPKIKPERGSEIELGADAGLLDGRLGFEATYYNKTTTDALMEIAVPASTGFVGFSWQNLGEINNKGVEVAVSATPVKHRIVTWDSRLSFSTNSNKLISFGYDRDNIKLSLYGSVQRHQPGYPLGGYWGNFPQRDASGRLVRDPVTGTLVAAEQVYIGPSTPTRESFFSNTVTLFNNLRVFALLDYKGGHYLYNVKDQYRCWGQPVPTTWTTNPADRIPGQCWEVNDPNRSDEFKEIRQQDISINNGVFIQRADFIKVRDVSVTYALPATLARRVRTSRAAVTLAAHNLGFLWKPHYTGPDPEVNFTGVNDPGGQFAYVRVDSWTAPMTRRLTASLEVTF